MSRPMSHLPGSQLSHRGPATDGAFSGAAGGSACGDLARVSLSLAGGRIEAVSFDAEGCAATTTACEAAAELCEGRTVLEAARIGAGDLDQALGGLLPQMRHAAGLVADALARALAAAAASGQQLAEPSPGRVLVAMSGGVDSASAALLEREAGREVVAVTLKLWADRATDGARSCCSPEAVVSARALAHSLDLPHFTLDLEERFRAGVVDRFVSGYAAGRTPNPCVLCNGELRIEAMIDLAGRLGADCLVTGHYARVASDGEGLLLSAAADTAKDQSYMLAALPPRLLERLRFPLAELSKPAVRELAARSGLSVAKRPESQDLCFLAGEGKRAFLRREGGIEDRDGEIVDRRGRRLGRHRGQHHFTVGQRRGIGVPGPRPLYVLGTDAASNTVTVGVEEELRSQHVGVRDAVLHRGGERVDGVRLRYHSKVLACEPLDHGPGDHEQLELRLREPAKGVAPGQLATLLCGQTIVGHGTIA